MTVLETPTRAETLQERLARGAELLFDLEQRGDTDERYETWLSHWVELLRQYETLQAA